LSEICSTASLDKHPESQARGITLDLGFSSFLSTTPDHWRPFLPGARRAGTPKGDSKTPTGGAVQKSSETSTELAAAPPSNVRFCLVDCPGHASLIRTVIGGAQIIDVCCLVIDANKGIQTQTAECIVVAELLVSKVLIVLNKIDMIPVETRAQELIKITKKLRKTFAKTKFGKNVKFCCVRAKDESY
jgi:selenocysteine-specific elongation factor